MLPDMVVEWQQSAPQPMLSVGGFCYYNYNNNNNNNNESNKINTAVVADYKASSYLYGSACGKSNIKLIDHAVDNNE